MHRLPRLSLRKRKVNTDRCCNNNDMNLNLTSVNSAFLTGLFADVAEVDPTPSSNKNSSHETITTTAATALATNTTTPCTNTNIAPTKSPSMMDAEIRPGKKSRVSMSRSISRCAKSFKSLGDALLVSPNCATQVVRIQSRAAACLPTFSQSDFFMRQVSPDNHNNNIIESATALYDVDDVDVDDEQPIFGASLVFPHLPTAVSISSSCNTLTRDISDLQSSVAEAVDKESSYGWFVVMDPHNEFADDAHYNASSMGGSSKKMGGGSSNDLAFLAPTAPLASNHDDEVEWAKAADTVDDVLGDFF
jgi:hypothetical protein